MTTDVESAKRAWEADPSFQSLVALHNASKRAGMGPLVLDAFGTRWFNEREGNTYHRARVGLYLDGAILFSATSPVTYGYWDAWEQTAAEMLGCDALFGLRKPGILVLRRAIDVERRKDL